MMNTRISEFEEQWNSLWPGYSIKSIFENRYNQYSQLILPTNQFVKSKIEAATDSKPSIEWISEALRNFVRGEFGTSVNLRGKCPNPISPIKKSFASEEVFHQYLNVSERSMRKRLETLFQNADISDVSARLYELLADPVIGNRANSKNTDPDLIQKTAMNSIHDLTKLQFILPSFPFKDQNIFRTIHEPEDLDFAEVALMIKLHTIALAVQQVYTYGAHWVIISDGLAYSSILRVDEMKALEYRKRLIEYRNKLNLNNTVSIVDLKELTEQIASKSEGTEVFEKTKKHIAKALSELSKEGTDFSLIFQVLGRGMKWNTNFKDLIQKYNLSWEDCWVILNTENGDEVPTDLKRYFEEFSEIVRNVAIEYAAFNLALKFHNVYESVLPNSIRATIHPKHGQFAVPSLGGVYPWNGVAMINSKESNDKKVEVIELYKLNERFNSIKAMILPGQDIPIFYEVS